MSANFVGDINERGFLNSLERQGFNNSKATLEMLGNCIDKGASDINIVIEK